MRYACSSANGRDTVLLVEGTFQPVQVTRDICLQLKGTIMLNGALEELEHLWQDITHEFGTSLG